MWSGIVDVDSGMKDRVILTYRIYHDAAHLAADWYDIADIAFESHSVVHG